MKLDNSQIISVAQAQYNLKLKMNFLAQRTYRELCKAQKEGMQQVWDNPDGLTPQQACDALKTEAGSYFAAHRKLTELIVSLAAAATPPVAPDITLPTHKYTLNEDGTVTVN